MSSEVAGTRNGPQIDKNHLFAIQSPRSAESPTDNRGHPFPFHYPSSPSGLSEQKRPPCPARDFSFLHAWGQAVVRRNAAGAFLRCGKVPRSRCGSCALIVVVSAAGWGQCVVIGLGAFHLHNGVCGARRRSTSSQPIAQLTFAPLS